MCACPKRLRMVFRLTPSLINSVAWVCRSWCRVHAIPACAQYCAQRSWMD